MYHSTNYFWVYTHLNLQYSKLDGQREIISLCPLPNTKLREIISLCPLRNTMLREIVSLCPLPNTKLREIICLFF